METVLITSLKNDFDIKLAETFARESYRVFAIGNSKVVREPTGFSNKSSEIAGVAILPEDLKEAYTIVEKDLRKIDLYIDTSDWRSPKDNFTITDGLDEEVMRNVYEANVLKPMLMLETFLPLLDSGEGKRLCFLTSASAGINETRDTDGYAYKMGKAAMHNFFQMISNKLTPKGYTFRVYDPMQWENSGADPIDEISSGQSAFAAFNYFTRRRAAENSNPLRDDENRLVFRDALGREHAW